MITSTCELLTVAHSFYRLTW